MILAMGRRESDSSPANSLVNSCPARIPLNMRMVEPEFPQSRGELGASNFAPRPWIDTEPPLLSHFTPNVRKHPKVLAQSAPVDTFSTFVSPSAIPPTLP